MRRAVGQVHRLDANHQAIVDGLRRLGASVSLICPADILCGFRNRNWLFEVKTARGKLSASERAFIGTWRGQHAVIRSLDDALGAMGLDSRAKEV